jgi:hypothetical protein
MERKDQQQATRSWTTRHDEKKRRMGLVSSWMSGPLLPREKLVDSLEALERHRRELLVHCYRMLGSLPDAEDAVQETFTKPDGRDSGFTEDLGLHAEQL